MSRRVLLSSLALVLAATETASAQESGAVRVTLDDVIAIARRDAPAPRVARARVDEARSSLIGARLRSTENPVLETNVGPRFAAERSTDVNVSLLVPLTVGRARARRIDAAEAETEQAQFLADESLRGSRGDAVAAYFRVLHAQRRIALATERLALATEAEQIAKDREAAGDVAQFEVDLARGEVARARSAVASGNAILLRREADLRAQLGIGGEQTINVEGKLEDWARLGVDAPERAPSRPDVQALHSEIAIAEAEAALARTSKLPDFALRVAYAHEHDADIALVGVSFSLPVFNRGQGELGRARAREQRARLELAVREEAVSTEIAGARASYRAFVGALVPLEQEAIPAATENADKAADAYRAGKIDLAALLLIRREALETRMDHLDALLEASLAAVDLWVALGSPDT